MADVIDWTSIPQIQADLDRLAGARTSPHQENVNLGEWFRDPDKEYLLRVKVIDVDLAQVVLTRAFSNESRIPGMEILEVGLDPNAEKNRSTVQMLRELADRLELEDQYG